MKIKIILLLIALAGYFGISQAQYLVNQGADIKISPGSSLVIEGDFRNQLDGSMDNDGEVLITGDWINNQTSGNLLQGTTGTVRMVGTTVQNITGTAITYFNNLDLQNNAMLGGAYVAVSSSLQLSGTYLTLGNSTLVMSYGSPILGANASGYIISNGSGTLRQQVGASDKVYPIGTIAAFTPVTLNNTGTVDYYSIRVFPDVLTNGTTGVTIPEINDCVNMTWDITELVSGGSDLSVTPSWGAALEGSNFDRTQCGVGHYTGGGWDPQYVAPVAGINPYWITRSGITTLSAFAVGDLESPMAEYLRVDLTVMLEGPYNTSTNLMNLDLKAGGHIPFAQPYNQVAGYYSNPNDPVWSYPGAENVPSIPADVVDWVIVQLRDATSPGAASSATILDMQAAFILANGSIVGLNGSSLLEFPVSVVNDLYVVVYHRNHLGIISNFPLPLSSGSYTYDFSSGEMQVYGGASGHKEVEPGIWAMVAADGDADGNILPSDETNVWVVDINASGYLGGDYDLNSLGQPADKTGYWVPNSNKSGQVPNVKGELEGYQSQIPD